MRRSDESRLPMSLPLPPDWCGWCGVRIPATHHEDWRYPLLREYAGRFGFGADLFAIHVFPTLQVFAGLIPVYVVATRVWVR